MRIGVLGGTFDPIHIAHLIIAEEARERLCLEEVVFIPAGMPWMKEQQPVSPGEVRLQMLRLAVASNPFFRVSDLEIERSGATYTVETLEALRDERGKEAEIYFIVGMDTLEVLHRWKEPQRLLELCTPVVFGRPGHSDDVLEELETPLPGLREKVRVLDGPAIDVSSTEIRRRVAKGSSIRYMVPYEVEQFIAEHGLYRDKASR